MAQILVYGDSNSHGTCPLQKLGALDRYPPGQPWPDVMAAALGSDHGVIAEGLPGRTTVHDDPVEGGARSGVAVLPAVLGSHVPLDLVVILLGTNDLKGRFSVSAHEIARSLERLVQVTRAGAPGAAILLVVPAPVAPAGVLTEVFAGAEARQAGLEAHVAAAAERSQVAYMAAGDHVTVSPVDGVHLSAEAHAVLGRAVAAKVREILGEV